MNTAAAKLKAMSRVYAAWAASILAFQPMPLDAQSTLQSHQQTRTIGLEALRTHHTGQSVLSNYQRTWTTAALFVSGRFATPSVDLIIEFPLAHFASASGFEPASTIVGNPYVGAEYALTTTTRLSAGARIPLARTDELATIVGFVADADRAEAFLADLATVRLSASQLMRPLPWLEIQGELGSSVWIPTETDHAADWIPPLENVETLLDYGAQGRLVAGDFSLRGGVTGRLELTEGGSLSERAMHQAVLAAAGRLGRISPALLVRVPLDGDARVVSQYTWGLSVRLRY